MFVDAVKLTFIAGKGGNGVVAWRREKFIPKGGPTGGNGGNGGSIILKADPTVTSLEAFRHLKKIEAPSGEQGGSNLKQGKTGKDQILLVPLGTLVKDALTGALIYDLTEKGQTFTLCKGGKGGKGNNSFKSSTNQAPNIFTEGTYGQSKSIELELKLIAEIGLIGMPNAGKSTLMKALTNVPVKIGAYPFTTLFPNLGYIRYEDYHQILLADIPGIIQDAHLDKGLGFAFLKHIERSKALIFVIDISGSEDRNPIDDFKVLLSELTAYRDTLCDRPFLIALNKSDEALSSLYIESFKEAYPEYRSRTFTTSGLSGVGIPALKKAIRQLASS
jgi:GTP-binding protein